MNTRPAPTASSATAAASTDSARPASHASTKPLQFVRRGEIVSLHDVPPTRTLLEVLREDLHCTGTKEGCGEGDCGACTVVVGELDPAAPTDGLRLRSVNSCIRLAHSVQGMAVWTVEDLTLDPTLKRSTTADAAPAACATSATCNQAQPLHPAQQAMLQCHGSQCGFCTPGFVMSLFGMYHNRVLQGEAIGREQAQHDLAGNLCRCTGYRPIFDAAQTMGSLPKVTMDSAAVRQQLAAIAQSVAQPAAQAAPSGYMRPDTLAAALALRSQCPEAQVVAGCTDVGLWITKMHKSFERILDLSQVRELRTIETAGAQLRIGASATVQDAFDALAALWPSLRRFGQRFAALPVRNSATVGGNVANGSPIGDSMPLFIALNAQVELASVRGTRRLPLEQLYTGYRQNVIAADEIVSAVCIPQPTARDGAWVQAYKISKRQDDDISAVCLALQVRVQGGVVAHASLGAGGVAATPMRAQKTEAALRGQAWNEATVRQAMAVLAGEFSPISDMRASGDYRRDALTQLLWRFWLHSQSKDQASPTVLASLDDWHAASIA